MFRHRPIQTRQTQQSNNTDSKYDPLDYKHTTSTSTSTATSASHKQYHSPDTHSHDRERSYNHDRHERTNTRNVNFMTDSDDTSEREHGLDNPDERTLLKTQNLFDIKRDVNTLTDPLLNIEYTSQQSAYEQSGLQHYGPSTFHLHPPATDTGVWDFESALFEPATLSICEGEKTFSMTIIPNVGFRKQDLKLSVQADMLVVHGMRDRDFEWSDDKGYAPSRRRIPLTFTRYIPLPLYVDKHSVQAVYYKWKLHIYINKKSLDTTIQQSQQRLQQITINDYENISAADQQVINQQRALQPSNDNSPLTEPLPVTAPTNVTT